MEEEAKLSLRGLALPIYAPSVLHFIGDSLAIPVVPLFVTEDLGGDLAAVGGVLSAFYFGKLVLNVPVGKFSRVHGEKRTTVLGLLVYAVASLLMALSPTVSLFGIAQVLLGGAMAALQVVATRRDERCHCGTIRVWLDAKHPKEGLHRARLGIEQRPQRSAHVL